MAVVLEGYLQNLDIEYKQHLTCIEEGDFGKLDTGTCRSRLLKRIGLFEQSVYQELGGIKEDRNAALVSDAGYIILLSGYLLNFID